MSFGFSPSDIVALVNITSKAYHGWKNACGEYSEVTGSLDSLLIILERVEKEASKPKSVLLRTTDDRKALEDILFNSEPTVRELNAIVTRFKSLGSSREKNWDRLRLGAKNLEPLRNKLSQHIAAISAYLDAVGLGALGRIERDLNAIPERIQRTVDALAAEIRAGRREGSIMTTYSDDEKDVWKQFRRELIGEGMRSSFVHKYKPLIRQYLKKLAERGELEELSPDDERLMEETWLESSTQCEDMGNEIMPQDLQAPGTSCKDQEDQQSMCEPVQGCDKTEALQEAVAVEKTYEDQTHAESDKSVVTSVADEYSTEMPSAEADSVGAVTLSIPNESISEDGYNSLEDGPLSLNAREIQAPPRLSDSYSTSLEGHDSLHQSAEVCEVAAVEESNSTSESPSIANDNWQTLTSGLNSQDQSTLPTVAENDVTPPKSSNRAFWATVEDADESDTESKDQNAVHESNFTEAQEQSPILEGQLPVLERLSDEEAIGVRLDKKNDVRWVADMAGRIWKYDPHQPSLSERVYEEETSKLNLAEDDQAASDSEGLGWNGTELPSRSTTPSSATFDRFALPEPRSQAARDACARYEEFERKQRLKKNDSLAAASTIAQLGDGYTSRIPAQYPGRPMMGGNDEQMEYHRDLRDWSNARATRNTSTEALYNGVGGILESPSLPHTDPPILHPPPVYGPRPTAEGGSTTWQSFQALPFSRIPEPIPRTTYYETLPYLAYEAHPTLQPPLPTVYEAPYHTSQTTYLRPHPDHSSGWAPFSIHQWLNRSDDEGNVGHPAYCR